MGNPISLRNISLHALELAQHLCEHTGLSIADVLRQAIVSGLLVEATKFAPLEDGTLGGFEPTRLAKALRRHLSSAIDVLLEYDEHPYQRNPGKEKSEQHFHLLRNLRYFTQRDKKATTSPPSYKKSFSLTRGVRTMPRPNKIQKQETQPLPDLEKLLDI